MQPPHAHRPDYRPQQQQPTPPPVHVIDKSAARVLSALAHGAIAFGFFGIGFLVSLAIAGVVWLYGKRSPQVRFHSEQAGCYQCSVLLINIAFIVVLGVAGGFSFFNFLQGRGDWNVSGVVVIGVIFFAIWFVLSILYGIFAAVMVLLGKPFKYPIIGNRIRET